MNDTINIDNLSAIIMNTLRGLDKENADELALKILNIFGYNLRIVDNVLDPEDRDFFYVLEDSNILISQREEITLYDGREWRIHYWTLNKKVINSFNHTIKDNSDSTVINKVDEYADYSVYQTMDWDA